MRKIGILKRSLGVALALMTACTSLPGSAYAAAPTAAVETQTDTESGSGVQRASETASVTPAASETAVGNAAASNRDNERVVEDLNWHDDPYPLDLLILEPDSEEGSGSDAGDPFVDNGDSLSDTGSEEALDTGGELLPEIGAAPEECESEEVPAEEAPLPEDLDPVGEDIVSGDFTYTLTDDKATVTGYSGTETTVVIPNTLDGYTVTAIGASAFRSKSDIVNITIPDTVTYIGDYAFYNCSGLKTVTLPKDLTAIKRYTFCGCSLLGAVDIPSTVQEIGAYVFSDCESITSVTIPEGVTSFGEYAFKNCESLADVKLPTTLTSVSNYAFYGCTTLETVSLPDGVLSIGNNAFYNCTGLKSISLPLNLETIGSNVFYGDTLLTEIVIPKSVKSIGSNAFYNSVSGVTFSEGMQTVPSYACYGANLLEEVSIPGTVTTIDSYAFYGCEKLNQIQLPSGVTTINNNAFSGCKTIKSVDIPDGVSVIAENTFYGCIALESVDIPTNVTEIRSGAFRNCTSLLPFELPSGLTIIGSYAFYGDTLFTEVTIPASVTNMGGDAFYNSVKKIVFADGFETLPEQACYDMNLLETVEFPASLKEIGARAFYNCGKLTGIKLPSNLTIINTYTFYGCDSLDSIDIPASVTQIGSYAFYGCKALKSVVLPADLTALGSSAFYGCELLEAIDIPAGVTTLESNTFSRCKALVTVNLPDEMTIIGERAFEYCQSLETIKLPSGLNTLGRYVFYGCSALKSVELPADLEVIDNYTFYMCEKLEFPELPGNLTTIGERAFYGCTSLKAINIPGKVTNIGSGAFYECTALEVVRIPASIVSVGRSAFYNSTKSVIFADGITAIPDYVCDGATNLTEVVLPSGVVSIGKQSFYGCTLLEKVQLPEGLKTVGYRAFYGDTSLTVTIVESITEIGEEAFAGCTIMKSCGSDAEWIYDQEHNFVSVSGEGEIVDEDGDIFAPFSDEIQFAEIQDGVTVVGEHSFEGMDQLTGVVIGDSVQSIGERAFATCPALERVELSAGLESIEKQAFSGCDSMETFIFTGSIPQIEATALPSQRCNAYYPKSDESYTKSARNQFTTCKWREWDDALPTRDVVLVLDVSGSMSGDKIESLKTAVCAFADKVGGRITNTRIAIVTYASEAKVVMPFSTDVTRMKAYTKAMSANGGTYYLKGFDEAEKLLTGSASDLKSFILFSDGEPSDSRSSILEKAEFYRNEAGYYIYCVGLEPTEYARELLIEIAGSEDNYFEADDIDEMVTRFVEMSNEIGRSGSCGDNVVWKYRDKKKQMVISLDSKLTGTGKMNDYSSTELPPWDAYSLTVEKLLIEKGVTYIGTSSFAKMSNVTSVQIGMDVKEIGSGAFSGCTKLANVYYPGKEADWKKINIGSNNDPLLKAKISYNQKDPSQPSAESVASVLVKPSSALLPLGETVKLEASVSPKNASNKAVTWSSSDTSVATVGNTGEVKAVNNGTAIITAVTADGGFTSTCEVTVTNNIPVVSQLSLGGSSNGIKVDDNVPIIGGKSFNIDLPVTLPVSAVVEDNKIKVGINIKKKNLYSYNSTEGVTTTTYKKKSLKEQFESFKENAMKASYIARDEDWLKNVQDKRFLDAKVPGMTSSVTLDVVGYAEGAWSDHLQYIEGSVVLTIKGSATAQHQMVVWVIPVTVECQFSASGSLTADVGYDFDKASWYGDLELAAKLGIEPYGGVGVGQWISVGVYGKASTDFNIILVSSRKPLGLESWKLSGEMGVKGYFAMKSGSFPIVSGTYQIYPRQDNRSAFPAGQSGLYAVGEESMIVETLEPVASTQGTVPEADGTIVTEAYNSAKPALITANGVTMMTYVTDDRTRSLLNQTKLVYSIYDPETGSYSDPVAVMDDGTADFEPVFYSDGTDIYVAWLDSKKTFEDTEDPGYEEYMSSFRTHVAKYDAATNSFTDLGTPQTNECAANMYSLYAADGDLHMAWAETVTDSAASSGESVSLHHSVYSGSAWSSVRDVTGLNAVRSMTLGRTSSSSAVVMAYAADQAATDGEDTDRVSQDLYLAVGTGSPSKKCSGNISCLSYTELPGVTGTVLAANVDGGLSYLDGSSFTQLLPENTMNMGSPFYVSGERIVYAVDGENSRNLSVAVYDNGDWGTTSLTHEDAYVDSFSVDNGKVSYLRNAATKEQDDTWNITSTVKIMDSLDHEDVELLDVDYALVDVCAGCELPVNLCIKNNGTSRLTRVEASVSYGGKELTYEDVYVDIMPGEIGNYDFSFDLPSILSDGGDFVVTVKEDYDENQDNNSFTLSLMKAELEVTSSFDGSGETPEVLVTVENGGLLDSDMVMTVTDENGNVLSRETEVSRAGNALTFREPYRGEGDQLLTISVNGNAEEFYGNNNVSWVMAKEAVYGESFNVSFTDTVSDPYEGLYYNESEDRYEIVYTGSAIKPEISVTGVRGKLKEGVDYTVKYKNNTNYDKKGNAASVIISGKGDYSGKKILDFYILQADMYTARQKGLLLVPSRFRVKKGQKVTPVLIYRDKVLKSSDLLVEPKKGLKSSSYVNISGKGNFTGDLSSIYASVVSAKSLKEYGIKASVKAQKHVYNGEAQTLTCSTADTKGELTVTAGKDRTVLTEGTDYTVEYRSNTDVGTAKVVITGMGSYYGTVVSSFKITADRKADLSAALTYPGEILTYDPRGVRPEISVTSRVSSDKVIVLKENVDYKVSYSNNKSVGKGKYSVKFMGNYKGNPAISKKEFEIGNGVLSDAVVCAQDVVYTKPGKYQVAPYVAVNGTKLSSKDYSVSYSVGGVLLSGSDKIELSEGEQSRTVTVTVTGKGNFEGGETTATYRVIRKEAAPIDLSKAKIVAYEQVKGKDKPVAPREFTGKDILPEIRVLVKGENGWNSISSAYYTVTGISSRYKGKGTIMITGDGENAVGSAVTTFKINAKDMQGFKAFGK